MKTWILEMVGGARYEVLSDAETYDKMLNDILQLRDDSDKQKELMMSINYEACLEQKIDKQDPKSDVDADTQADTGTP